MIFDDLLGRPADEEHAPVFFGAERIVRIAFPGLIECFEKEHGRV